LQAPDLRQVEAVLIFGVERRHLIATDKEIKMTQPVIPPTITDARFRKVAPEALKAAYLSIYPQVATDLAAHPGAVQTWLSAVEADPAGTIGQGGKFWGLALAYFKALDLPRPNTPEMALFVLTNPDLEKQPTELTYVRASTPGGENVDLIVRAVSREHAVIAWRNHFDGWDLPDRPTSVTVLPQAGPPGALPWEGFESDEEEGEHLEESQAPGA